MNASDHEIAKIGDESGVVLSVIERKIIQGALSGHTIAEIATNTGVEPTRVRKFLRAQDVPQLRRAFQRVLDSRGLTATAMADKGKELLEAKEAKWNKEDGDWDFFPANGVQANVWKHLTKLQDLEPGSHNAEAKVPALAVQINVDLGDGKAAPEGRVAGTDPDRIILDIPVTAAQQSTAAQKNILDGEE